MPRGDKSSYSSKQKRQAKHIEDSEKNQGRSTKSAKRIAWATVNKQSSGDKGQLKTIMELIMDNSLPRTNPEKPVKPQEVPGKENTPKQPETYPPGDTPVTPTDPSKQPISIEG